MVLQRINTAGKTGSYYNRVESAGGEIKTSIFPPVAVTAAILLVIQ